jgi:hypothetical protein
MTIEHLIQQLERELVTLKDLRIIKIVQMQIDYLYSIKQL